MIGFLAALVEDRRLAVWTAGALAVVAGAVAPWVRIASPLRPLVESGLDADGKLTLLAGAAALALCAAYARLRHRDLAVGAIACAAATLGLALVYASNVRTAAARVVARVLDVDPDAVGATFAPSAEIGLWATLAGAVAVLIAAATVALGAQPSPRPAAEPHAGAPAPPA